jgi:hypothetical protein
MSSPEAIGGNFYAGGYINSGSDMMCEGVMRANTGLQTPSIFVAGLSPNSTVYTDASKFLTSTAPSDINLKTNIQNLDVGLNFVLGARPVMFNWRNNLDPGISFIAQEIDKLDRRFVKQHHISEHINEHGQLVPATSYLGLKSDWFVPVLFKAIQQQQEQIEDLKAQLQQLKSQ